MFWGWGRAPRGRSPGRRRRLCADQQIVEKIVASSLIYLPSSTKDFKNPAIEPYLKQYVRGSHGIDYKERIKIMKLLWDAIGTEFGGRHELYEYNYAGNHEDIRIHALLNAKGSGAYDAMIALADQCMADYDDNGWTGDTWTDKGWTDKAWTNKDWADPNDLRNTSGSSA